ncbi:hypothetical protein JCM6882_006912 [Rhodosporidiobolus microsporus]
MDSADEYEGVNAAARSYWTQPLREDGKGKGRGERKGRDARAGSATRPMTEGEEHKASVKLSKDDLAHLEGVDSARLAAFLEQNSPTPVGQLPLSHKLVMAIQILAGGADTAINNDSPEINLSSHASARLFELLGSALAVAPPAQLPSLRVDPRVAEAASRIRAGQEAFEAEQLRSEMGLPCRPESSRTDAGIETPSSPVDRGISPASNHLVSLFAENTKLAAALFRPEALFDPPTYSSHETVEPESALDTQPERALYVAPSPINRLPVELLSRIFRLAHASAREPLEPGDGGWGSPQQQLLGSKAATAQFVLGLSTVCKSWTDPAREVALSAVQVRHAYQLPALNRILDPSKARTAAFSTCIASLDILLVVALRVGNPSHPHAFHGGGRGFRAPPPPDHGAFGGEVDEMPDVGVEFERLMSRASNLKELRLWISKTHGNGWGSDVFAYSDFLEAPVFRALTSLPPSLTALALRFNVDFEELESILASTPQLATLKIDALWSLPGANGVASSSANPAGSLRVVHLGNVFRRNASYLSSTQLVWLLEPSAVANSLQDLQLSLEPDIGRAGGGGWGGLGPALVPVAFASAGFADLLARCSSLTSLVLHDASLEAMADPSFAHPPHNDSLDFALSHLTSLTSLTFHLELTGASFLSTISSFPSLRALILYGSHPTTTARAFADALESDFPVLETVAFMPGGRGGAGGRLGPMGWSGSGIRRIQEVAERRGIEAIFSRS